MNGAAGMNPTTDRESPLPGARMALALLIAINIFNYIDRTSVGFAALSMNADLGLSATQFGWGAGILFAGYCLLEVPSNFGAATAARIPKIMTTTTSSISVKPLCFRI